MGSFKGPMVDEKMGEINAAESALSPSRSRRELRSAGLLRSE